MGFNYKRLFLPHSSGSWKSRIKHLVRTVFLACGQPPSCCILTWQKERLFLLGHQSCGIRDSLMTSLSLNHPLTGSISNTVTLEGGLQQGVRDRTQSIEVLCFSPPLSPPQPTPMPAPKDPVSNPDLTLSLPSLKAFLNSDTNRTVAETAGHMELSLQGIRLRHFSSLPTTAPAWSAMPFPLLMSRLASRLALSNGRWREGPHPCRLGLLGLFFFFVVPMSTS